MPSPNAGLCTFLVGIAGENIPELTSIVKSGMINRMFLLLIKKIPTLIRVASLAAVIPCLDLYADVTEDLLRGVLVEGITVDLREPSFCEGVLTTDKGGVITGPGGVRVQARKIIYTRKQIDEKACCTIEAEGDLMLEFGRYVFVGDRLEYDFQSMTGVIFCGRTGISPWYIGGEAIQLCSDGSYIVYQGFLTTSESYDPDWQVTADQMKLKEDQSLQATNVRFHFIKLPVFWLPSLKINLDSIFDNPFNYTIGWGGKQGPRLGMEYEVFDWNRWKAFLRADYRLKRGLGGGFEVRHHSIDRRENFEMINYISQDSSIFLHHEHTRYLFQGNYNNLLMDDKLSIDLTWEKLSDKDMATDYADQGLELETAGRTELEIRRQEDRWISNLLTRVRLNNFDTLKQELPTFETSWRPITLGSTGIISDNQIQASYLDFTYSHNLIDVHDYNSARLSSFNNFYRPFLFGPVNFTPEVGATSVFYGNSHRGHSRWAVLGMFGFDVNAPVYKRFSFGKHVLTPYFKYKYFTFPTSSPDQHYIFDIDDGLYRLDMAQFGFEQSFYSKDWEGNLCRYLYTNFYTNAFFDTETIPHVFQKLYANMIFNTCSTLRHTFNTAWDLERSEIDHFNFLSEWTVNEDLAISAEYRYRDAYDWRKADHTNFILDSFRSVRELHDSPLSDKRNTGLLHIFYRFHPSWAIEYESRHGWHRTDHTRFNEFEVDLLATLRSAVKTQLSYQHTEGEDRIAIYFTIGADRPDRKRSIDLVPFLDF